MTQAPGWGWEAVRVLPDGEVEVISTSETVLAKQTEDREQFIARLCREFGVGPSDGLMIVYKARKPRYAIIEWKTRLPGAAGDHEALKR